LSAYEGTILFVSHDRYFIDQVATRVLTFEEGRVCTFEGNYSTWLDTKRRREEEERQRLEKKAAGVRKSTGLSESDLTQTKRKRKFPYRRADEIEQEIAEREAEVARLQEEMGNPEVLRDGMSR
jgi:ATP-binding cassette subfamily F protein 3